MPEAKLQVQELKSSYFLMNKLNRPAPLHPTEPGSASSPAASRFFTISGLSLQAPPVLFISMLLREEISFFRLFKSPVPHNKKVIIT